MSAGEAVRERTEEVAGGREAAARQERAAPRVLRRKSAHDSRSVFPPSLLLTDLWLCADGITPQLERRAFKAALKLKSPLKAPCELRELRCQC